MNVLAITRCSNSAMRATRSCNGNQFRSRLLNPSKLPRTCQIRPNRKFSGSAFTRQTNQPGEKAAEGKNSKEMPEETKKENGAGSPKENGAGSPKENGAGSPKENTTESKKDVDLKDEKIAKLEEMTLELRRGLKEALAEAENTRKRMQKDVDKAKEFGIEKLVKNIFQVTDTLNVCIQNKPNFADPAIGENKLAKSAFEGLEATKRQITSIFRDNYSIEEYFPKIGESFDPMKHDALFEVDSPNPAVTPGQVGLVVKSGWKRNDSLLRVAAVGVVKQKKQSVEEVKPETGKDVKQETAQND